MKKLTLGDVCKKASSNIAQKDLLDRTGKYPVFGASGFIKNIDFYHQNDEYIAVVKDGSGIGRTMLLPAYSSVIGTMQYLIPTKKVDIDILYLYYAIVHMNLSKYYSLKNVPNMPVLSNSVSLKLAPKIKSQDTEYDIKVSELQSAVSE